MSLLSWYLEWFAEQSVQIQLGSTVLLFAALFIFGLYTLGIGPAIVIILVLVDHWYRGQTE